MKQRSSIQKFIAFLLLLVFAVSTAPKAYFHDLLANHKDVAFCHHPPTTSDCVHKQGYNCHFDDLVVTAPFLMGKVAPVFSSVVAYTVVTSNYQSSYSQYCYSQKISRGPPAV